MHLYSVDQVKKGEEEGAKERVENDVRTLSILIVTVIGGLSLSSQCGGFYALLPDGMSGSISYMAKAVVNRLLQQGLSYDTSTQCCIS